MKINLTKEEALKILFKKLSLDQVMGWVGCTSFFLSLVSGLGVGWGWFLKWNVEPKASINFIVIGIIGLLTYIIVTYKMTE